MTCEKCWRDAGMRALSMPYKSQTEHYQDLIKEREDSHCTEAEQKGGCPACKWEDMLESTE